METTIGRPDLYTAVHKGLRACMSHALVSVGNLETSDPHALGRVVADVHELLRLCRVHLEDENVFVHAALEARAPGLVSRASDDHAHHEETIAALERLASELVDARGDAALEAQRALYVALGRFMAENLEHMRHEESVHTPALWATHTDEELLAIEHALVASIPPDAMQSFLRWMIGAATPGERAEMLSGMRDGAPPEVFSGVLELARETLREADYHALCRALGIAAPLALAPRKAS